ncbi:MAG TPA: parvulin peptidyl-prolyl isomerase [Desulfovibrio sp.]|jgi:parvulin-like peptidyl-prolyl isomerase|nr:parvulin peptidyl-prolyl isomerase [Desulfovibrio sp.]
MKRLLILCAALLFCSACSSAPREEEGVVARVNGRPIYLNQLEFQHDMLHLEISAAAPTVAGLKKEYGQILGQLIMLELVQEEMEARDLVPTDEEVKKAEETIRADYPPGAFEQVLIEEYIDLDSWRRQLRSHLNLERFFQQVLRPQVRIEYTEAEAYYQEHIQEFSLPPRLRLAVILAQDRDAVDKTLEQYRARRDIAALLAGGGPAAVREITVRDAQLPEKWRDLLSRLQPGQPTGILHDDAGFQSLILVERLPAAVLPPAQAYPLIEQALAEVKLQEAFEQWLSAKIAKAQIAVSAHLLPRTGEGAQADDSGRGEMNLLGNQAEGQEDVSGEGHEQAGEGVIMEPAEDQEVDQGDLEEPAEAAPQAKPQAGKQRSQ